MINDIGYIRMYHPTIFQRIKEENICQKGEKLASTSILIDAFVWENSSEGHDFWDKIFQGNYNIFYERYPEEKAKKEPEENVVSKLFEEKVKLLRDVHNKRNSTESGENKQEV